MIVLVQYNFTKQNNWLFRLQIVHLDFMVYTIVAWRERSWVFSLLLHVGPTWTWKKNVIAVWNLFICRENASHLFDISKLSNTSWIECLFLFYSSLFFFFLFFFLGWMSSYSSLNVIIICQKILIKLLKLKVILSPLIIK